MSTFIGTIRPKPGAQSFPQLPFQSVESFSQKLITTTITLSSQAAQFGGGSTTFAGSGGSNTIALSGYRTRVRITNSGGIQNAGAQIDIFGLPASIINQLLQAGPIFNLLQGNTVLVAAGTSAGGLSPVFSGQIYYSQGVFSNQPDVPFRMACQIGGTAQVAYAAPTSFAGATDVATMMSGIAKAMNLAFENNGVTAQLNNPYYPGNLYQQMKQIAEHAHINADIVDGSKLAIWPIGGSRTSLTTIPLLSPSTGMVGYPSFQSKNYMAIKHVFNPQIARGQTIEVQSSLPQANGKWIVNQLDLALDSLVPKGEWAGTAWCYSASASSPPPGPPSS